MADTRPMIRHAVRLLGSQAKLARAMGVSQARVSQLCKTVVQCTVEIALRVERATGGVMPAWHLRPDLCPIPEGALMPPPGFYDEKEAA